MYFYMLVANGWPVDAAKIKRRIEDMMQILWRLQACYVQNYNFLTNILLHSSNKVCASSSSSFTIVFAK